MNIVFVFARRFMRRLEGKTPAPFIFGAVVATIPVVWIFMYDSGMDSSQKIVFAVVMTVACGLGAHFGLKAGLKSQIMFQKKLEEHLRKTEKVPNELRRPYDNLNKN